MAKLACLAMVAVALVLACGGRVAEGQSDCASKLIPCVNYLNSTKPSTECCNAMKTVVTTQLACLCGLLQNPNALAGINITQALELPKHCNIPGDTSACNATQAPSGSTSIPPPATPGSNGGGSSGAGAISGMGMPALLLASAFTFFY